MFRTPQVVIEDYGSHSVNGGGAASWQTGRDEYSGTSNIGQLVEGVEIGYTRAGFNAGIAGWSNFVRTVTVSGLNGAAAPGRVKVRFNSRTGSTFYDPNPTHRRTPFPLNTPSTFVSNYFLEFSTLGTYVVEFKVDAVRSDPAMTTYTGAGRYTFHVGPVAESGSARREGRARRVLTLTALNHGPDDAPAARVKVTPSIRGCGSRGAQASRGELRKRRVGHRGAGVLPNTGGPRVCRRARP